MEPRRGCPLHRTPYKRLRRPACRGLSPRAGVPGKSAPDTLPAGLGRSGRVKGPCPRPCGAAGRTNPLTRPPLEKRATGPHRGLEGTVGWMGVKARATTAQRQRYDAQERPQRSGLVAGGALPPAACHVANAPEGRRRRTLAFDFLLLRFGVSGRHAPRTQVKGTDQAKRREGPLCILALDLSTTNEVCVSAPLFHFGRRRLGRLSGTPRLDYWSNISSVSGRVLGPPAGLAGRPRSRP